MGKALRTRAVNGSAKGELLEPAVLGFAPRIEAEPPNDFRLIGGVGECISLAVKRSDPVLHDATGNVAMNGYSGAAVRGGRRRVQHRLKPAFYEVQVGGADSGFLSEGQP